MYWLGSHANRATRPCDGIIESTSDAKIRCTLRGLKSKGPTQHATSVKRVNVSCYER